MNGNKQLVLFKISGQTFGVEIELIKEIITHRPIAPVPDAYGFIEGIINYRNKIVTVIDMRKRLHAPAVNEKSTRILVVDIERRLTGLIVDAASEIVRVPEDMIGPPPELISETASNYITGVARLGERLIVLLDLRRVLNAAEISKLDELIQILYAEKAED